MTEADGAGAGRVALPGEVRELVLGWASRVLGALKADEVPASLRPFRQFAPAKRARLAAGPLASALDTDPVFRSLVADAVRADRPELAAAVADGRPLPATPAADVAAVAYLLRPPGWEGALSAAADEASAREERGSQAANDLAVERLTQQLTAARAAGRDELARTREERDAAREETAGLRRRLRQATEEAAQARRAQEVAVAGAAAVREELAAGLAAAEAEARRLRQRLQEAERAAGAARSSARAGRSAEELRLRVLLDTVVGAAHGLRRELALPPAEGRPADALAAEYAAAYAGGAGPPGTQGRAEDDPALLDAWLGVPGAHLLVDGYNVTKGGYGALALEAQRARLLSGLGALVARTGAEVTVVFDGTDRVAPLATPSPRGVRLLFSRTGETADEVLRRLAAAEPPGRPVVVVSSDREVADGVRASGGRPVPSAALLRLLDRA